MIPNRKPHLSENTIRRAISHLETHAGADLKIVADWFKHELHYRQIDKTARALGKPRRIVKRALEKAAAIP